jgi:thiol-disulfide isomerase/thioredoxin
MAKGFYETLNRLFTPYYTLILSIVLLSVFSYIAYYLYIEYIRREQKIKDAKDVANSSGGAKINVLIRLFYTDWCPYSAKALPEWNNFKEKYNNEIYNQKKIEIVELDCSNENDSNVKKIIEENNVDSYPTIKMYKNDEIIDFDAKITYDNLEQFIETIL